MLLVLELRCSSVGKQLPRGGCVGGGGGGGDGGGGGLFGGGVGLCGSNQGRSDLGTDFNKEGVVEASRDFGVVIIGIGAGVLVSLGSAEWTARW